MRLRSIIFKLIYAVLTFIGLSLIIGVDYCDAQFSPEQKAFILSLSKDQLCALYAEQIIWGLLQRDNIDITLIDDNVFNQIKTCVSVNVDLIFTLQELQNWYFRPPGMDYSYYKNKFEILGPFVDLCLKPAYPFK
jgi:hypothetical protein